jgi:hypothetical protein
MEVRWQEVMGEVWIIRINDALFIFKELKILLVSDVLAVFIFQYFIQRST